MPLKAACNKTESWVGGGRWNYIFCLNFEFFHSSRKHKKTTTRVSFISLRYKACAFIHSRGISIFKANLKRFCSFPSYTRDLRDWFWRSNFVFVFVSVHHGIYVFLFCLTLKILFSWFLHTQGLFTVGSINPENFLYWQQFFWHFILF